MAGDTVQLLAAAACEAKIEGCLHRKHYTAGGRAAAGHKHMMKVSIAPGENKHRLEMSGKWPRTCGRPS